MRIPVANLYYLLSYAWQRLPDGGVGGASGEDGGNLADLFARFLGHGFLRLARRGLDRGYVERDGEMGALRGRGLWMENERRQSGLRGRVFCRYEELDLDTPLNRILKSAFVTLARDTTLDPKLLALLRLCLTWLETVPERPLQESALRGIQIHSGLREYGWMLDACRLLARWALPEPSGILRFQEVLEDEEEMRRLFEEFVRGFYKLEQSEYRVTASPLSWRWEPLDEVSRALLPGMRTDVMLSRGRERIVIDTKYTPRAVAETSGYYGGTLRSGHLYQMHAYLSTLAGEGTRPLKGILLYPGVDADVRATYRHADYMFEVRTVDLGAPWRRIHEELLLLVGTAREVRSSMGEAAEGNRRATPTEPGSNTSMQDRTWTTFPSRAG
jgi:5-methylcytosine-specific restriction enzyme subunit McrC